MAVGRMHSLPLATWPVEAPRSRSRGRAGLVTPTPNNGHLPALVGGSFHVQLERVYVHWIGPLE
jgi:hypothetical protein